MSGSQQCWYPTSGRAFQCVELARSFAWTLRARTSSLLCGTSISELGSFCMLAGILQGTCQGRFLDVSDGAPYARDMWKFEIYKGEDDGWRWRLVAHGTIIVFDSERFERRADAKIAAEVARARVGAAPIDVL